MITSSRSLAYYLKIIYIYIYIYIPTMYSIKYMLYIHSMYYILLNKMYSNLINSIY